MINILNNDNISCETSPHQNTTFEVLKRPQYYNSPPFFFLVWWGRGFVMKLWRHLMHSPITWYHYVFTTHRYLCISSHSPLVVNSHGVSWSGHFLWITLRTDHYHWQGFGFWTKSPATHSLTEHTLPSRLNLVFIKIYITEARLRYGSFGLVIWLSIILPFVRVPDLTKRSA